MMHLQPLMDYICLALVLFTTLGLFLEATSGGAACDTFAITQKKSWTIFGEEDDQNNLELEANEEVDSSISETEELF